MPPRSSVVNVPAANSNTSNNNNNVLLRCVQCRRPIEVLSVSQTKNPKLTEEICSSIYNCATVSSQDFPLCNNCWKQRQQGEQQQSLSDLSSLVETLSSVKAVHPAAIAAFKDYNLAVDPLSQQFVVAGCNNSSSSSCENNNDNEEEEDEQIIQDTKEYEEEQEQLYSQLAVLEKQLNENYKEVKQYQDEIAQIKAEEDNLDRQLNGAIQQEQAEKSAKQSIQTRLQTSRGGFQRLGVEPPSQNLQEQQQQQQQVTSSSSLVSVATTSSLENKQQHEKVKEASSVGPSPDRTQPSTSFFPSSENTTASASSASATTKQQVVVSLDPSIASTATLGSVLAVAFQLEFEDPIPRINNRRVGRFGNYNIPDDEINSGCGFLSLLMNHLFKYTRMEKTGCGMEPQGCESTITVYQPKNRGNVVDFYIKRRFFSFWSSFGQAWIHYAFCVNEVVIAMSAAMKAKAQKLRSSTSFAPSSATALFVTKMEEHLGEVPNLPKITESGQKVNNENIKYGDANDATWTSAVRSLFRSLKWCVDAEKFLTD